MSNEIKKNKNTYSTVPLQITKSKTLIILDWDDTLYPTTWAVENGIDLTNPGSRYKYVKLFENHDRWLASALEEMMACGNVIIITNAMPEWIHLSLTVLPKTKEYMSHIEIVSARKNYQNVTKLFDWKKYAFHEVINKRKNKSYNNILSLGDADYEYTALLNLYKHPLIKQKYLKSIKFIRSTDYQIMIQQIQMIKCHIGKIVTSHRHIDLAFSLLND